MTTIQETNDIDAAAVEEFAVELITTLTGALNTCLIDIGRRTGLFELALEGPATSQELADRGGLQERYVREWLSALATTGIFEYDATNGRFWLPREHAVLLTGDTYDNLTSVAYLVQTAVKHGEAVARCFTEGGGVPFASYLPELHDVMDALWKPMFRDLMVQEYLPLAPGLVERLQSGIRVADVACGSGNGAITLAKAFPSSTVVGYDQDAAAIAQARVRARGLANVTFEVADAASIRTDQPFGAVVVFNAIHDQARPAKVLSSILEALEPGGTFLMDEPRVSSHLEDNIGNPMAAFQYGISLLHCMTVSLAEGGAGLGTAWGEQVARQLLADAGFGPVTVHDLPSDPGNAVFVTHRPE